MFVTNSPFLLFLPHESTLCTFVFGHFIHHKLLYISFTSAERVCTYDNIVFTHNTMKIISTWESWYTFMFGAQLVFWHKWLPCIIPPWCTLVMCSGHCFFFFSCNTDIHIFHYCKQMSFQSRCPFKICENGESWWLKPRFSLSDFTLHASFGLFSNQVVLLIHEHLFFKKRTVHTHLLHRFLLDSIISETKPIRF